VQQLSDADRFEFQDRLALAALIANKRKYPAIRGHLSDLKESVVDSAS
jgi:hypothetical protein